MLERDTMLVADKQKKAGENNKHISLQIKQIRRLSLEWYFSANAENTFSNKGTFCFDNIFSF
jgi:hypothetical protein